MSKPRKKKKRTTPMRDGNPYNKNNWAIVCSACGGEFLNDETVDLADGHFQQEHPDLENPHFNTVWVGKGPAPSHHPGQLQRGRRR